MNLYDPTAAALVASDLYGENTPAQILAHQDDVATFALASGKSNFLVLDTYYKPSAVIVVERTSDGVTWTAEPAITSVLDCNARWSALGVTNVRVRFATWSAGELIVRMIQK